MSKLTDHDHPVDPERVARARAQRLTAEQAGEFSELLALVGEPVRLRVLSALAGGEELCVGDITLVVGLGEDSVSYALRVLRGGGLVERRAQGRMRYYRLASRPSHERFLRAIELLQRIVEAKTPP